VAILNIGFSGPHKKKSPKVIYLFLTTIAKPRILGQKRLKYFFKKG
jgi:hypothetical protein